MRTKGVLESITAEFGEAGGKEPYEGPRIENGYALAIASQAQKHTGGVVFVLTPTEREAEELMNDVRLFTACPCTLFPAWETLPSEQLSPSAKTVTARLKILETLNRLRKQQDTAARGSERVSEAASEGVSVGASEQASEAVSAQASQATSEAVLEGASLILFTSLRAFVQPMVPGLEEIPTMRVTEGAELEDGFFQRLQFFGYKRVDMVAARGEYAMRGGIVDIALASEEDPVRFELFGDTVTDMRPFGLTDQLSRENERIEAIEIYPVRELLLTEAVKERARKLEAHGFHTPETASMLSTLAAGIVREGMESYIDLLCPTTVSLTHYLPRNTLGVIVDHERCRVRALELQRTNESFTKAGIQNSQYDSLAQFLDFEPLLATGEFSHLLQLSVFHTGNTDETEAVIRPLQTHGVRAEEVAQSIRNLARENWKIIVAIDHDSGFERAKELLLDAGAAPHTSEKLPDRLEAGTLYTIPIPLHHGFSLPQNKIAVFGAKEFFGLNRYSAMRAKSSRGKRGVKRGKAVVNPLELKAGDYLVHEFHGVGRFRELMLKEVSVGVGSQRRRIAREFIVLEYAPARKDVPYDKLYVPVDKLDHLSYYVGSDNPQLSKMGGSDWVRKKQSARKAIHEIAIGLVKLYAQRKQARGHAFAPDNAWQRELEERFPYRETADQQRAIDEVKADMELDRPMDRLISGDVGFGKTEIAVRAAFKAVQDNMQVAVLVPTTLLVRQHIETFRERFAGFPVRVQPLSRFQTAKENRKTLQELAAGTIDVVIGTHKLLGKGVRFHSLGLIIIDEEQRFGVEHKEKLKALKSNVDVLSMSATPIPRTLEMAVTGIREMSVLTVGPEDRKPVLTYVGQRNQERIAAAIRREMMREGQVFFVHNRIQSIYAIQAELAELVPEARIALAHGKLSEDELEDVVIDFWQRKYDVLLCTTIIETGLDIANANTIIVDRADRYGLSQLHQLRGRVGRSSEQAYAYFFYDENRTPTENAYERLETIAQHNMLGAGMQIALKDLEIRGAGNLLGSEQAGHIAGVGFDLYMRMVGEMIGTLRGERTRVDEELSLELPVEARIPEWYIESERLRLEAYRKFSAAGSVAAGPLLAAAEAAAEEDSRKIEHAKAQGRILRLIGELRDRYGEPPEEVLLLAVLTDLRAYAAIAGVRKMRVSGGKLVFERTHGEEADIRIACEHFENAEFIAEFGRVVIPLPRTILDYDVFAQNERPLPLTLAGQTLADGCTLKRRQDFALIRHSKKVLEALVELNVFG